MSISKEHCEVLDRIAKSIKLRFCPCCAETEDLDNGATHGDWWWVECEVCGTQSSTMRTPQQSADIWNSMPRKSKQATESKYFEISKTGGEAGE